MSRRVLVLLASLSVSSVFAAEAPKPPAWVEQSNELSKPLLDLAVKYQPESASAFGIEGHDAEVIDLKPRTSERQEADLAAVAAQLEAKRASIRDSKVLLDLDILISAANNQRQTLALNRELLLPFFDLPQVMFRAFQDLIDERVDKKRQTAAVVRLRRYVGAEKGFEPITQLMRARYEEVASNQKLIGPWNVEVEQYLGNQKRYLDGIEKLLKDSGLKGWQNDFKTLSRQFNEYETWVRASVLPRARKTNQLPAALYADNLKNFGVMMNPKELMERALGDYVQTRDEIEVTAAQVAAERKWPATGYKDVIRALKKESIPKEKVLALYNSRLQQMEEIIRREHIVTLPERKAVIRLATEAESAATSAPHIDPPRLIGNTGEPAEFVLPLSNPNAKPGTTMDDFSYDSIAWTLTAHEARPGHELQFARMLEHGVSTARVVYAFNSANVEGWALYTEAVMKKYLPAEGRMGSLQMRMMREARAFLDPMLNLGLIEPAAAQRFLMEEVMLSEPMAKQEIDRYTFQAPGQATSYYYGYLKLNSLRTRVELAQPGKFDQLKFHDFIVNQGLLPFDLLEKSVMEDYVKLP